MEPKVSVVCITYNHEKYISDAIESFIMQETDFPFEIIIHDDASTDGTTDIIRKYEKMYPELIKPIYQEENQHSKGKLKKIITDLVGPMLKGKYVATCEGDDYWTDKCKLKKQVNFLENNSDYIMCFHPVSIVDTKKNFMNRFKGPEGNGSREITIEEMIMSGVMHYSSILVRKEYYANKRPGWMDHAMHGDYAFAVYISSEGKIFFLDEVMSNYRAGVEGSIMTKRKENFSKESEIKLEKNIIETYIKANEYYGYKYNQEIKNVILLSEVRIALLQNDVSMAAISKYNLLIKKRGITRFIKIFLLNKTPRFASLLVKIKYGKINKWICHG